MGRVQPAILDELAQYNAQGRSAGGCRSIQGRPRQVRQILQPEPGKTLRPPRIGARPRSLHCGSAGKYRYFVVYISTMRDRRIALGIARGPGSLHRSAVTPLARVIRDTVFCVLAVCTRPRLAPLVERKRCLKSLVSRRASSLSIPLLAFVKSSASRCRRLPGTRSTWSLVHSTKTARRCRWRPAKAKG